MRKIAAVLGILIMATMFLNAAAIAQIPPGEPGSPELEDTKGPPPYLKSSKPQFRDPAEKARMEKIISMRSTAEAYKNLSELYREQGKIDEAVAQLKKIIDLANSIDEKGDPKITGNIGKVYMQMAEMYFEKNRFADAENVLNEGIEKTKNTDPELCSRLALHLGKAQKKAGKMAEAEKTFQKVIELNSGKMSQPKK